jgi:hypothetical protein
LFDVALPVRGAYRDAVWLSGFRHGRAVRIGAFELSAWTGPLWEARIDLECNSTACFDVGCQDGSESYVAQIPDPVLREAVHRLVDAYCLQSIALNASAQSLPPPYRLRVTLRQIAQRPTLPRATAQAILDAAAQIAHISETQESIRRVTS